MSKDETSSRKTGAESSYSEMGMAGHVGWQKAPSLHARDPGFEFPRYGTDTV